jgi:hypothetical protein
LTPFGYPSKTIAKTLESFSENDREWAAASESLISSLNSYESHEEEWKRKLSMANWTSGRGVKWMPSRVSKVEVRPLDAVSATARLFVSGSSLRRRSTRIPSTDQWKRTYRDRTKAHSGFSRVHVNSLSDSLNHSIQHPLDKTPWEHRVIEQRFLYEQSVSFRRNWFGVLLPIKVNPMITHQPICRPRSMPMPVRAGKWIEEWYTRPWAQPLLMSPRGASPVASGSHTSPWTDRTYDNRALDDRAEDSVWEDVPECGKIRNVKLKIGERVSRVTPDLTSSLRRSRWRKKHFPRGTFPY